MSATLFGTSRRIPRRIPWPPLIALALTALIGLVAALPTVREAPARVLSTRSLVVDATGDGAVLLTDADTGMVAGRIAAGGESFVRGILHGAAVSRRLFSVDQRVPYRLTALSDGRLTLADAATNITIDLTSFGSTNARSFALLLDRPAQEPR